MRTFLAVLGILCSSLLAGAKTEPGEEPDSSSHGDPQESVEEASEKSHNESNLLAIKLPKARKFFEFHAESSSDDLTDIVLTLVIDPDRLEDVRISTPVVYWKAPDESVFAVSLLPIGETTFASKVYSASGESFAEGTHQIQASVSLRRMDNTLLAVYEQSIAMDLPSFELSPDKIVLAIVNSARHDDAATTSWAKRIFVFSGLLTLFVGSLGCFVFVLVQLGVIDPKKAEPWILKLKKLTSKKARKAEAKASQAKKEPAAPLPPGVMDDQPTIQVNAAESKLKEPEAPEAEKDEAAARAAEANVKEAENLVTQAEKPPAPAKDKSAEAEEKPAEEAPTPAAQAEEQPAAAEEKPAEEAPTPAAQAEEQPAEAKEQSEDAEAQLPEPEAEEKVDLENASF